MALCDECGRSTQTDGKPLKECRRCRIASYCCIECQKADWKSCHKFECFDPEQMQSRRAVARLNMAGLIGASRTKEEEIYYMKVSRPWIEDIVICGPFATANEMLSTIRRSLRFSRAGLSYLDNLREQNLLEQVAHIRGPLDADPSKEVLVELFVKNNPVLRAQLPCHVYVVACIEPGDMSRTTGRMRSPPARSIEVVGFFTSQKEADAAVRMEADSQVTLFEGGRSMTRECEGALCAVIVQQESIVRVIQSHFDRA